MKFASLCKRNKSKIIRAWICSASRPGVSPASSIGVSPIVPDAPTLTPDNAPIGHRCQFERIVMNPPFNKGQDLKHIAHAVTHWLRPGGELVAVMLPHTNDDISAALGDADDLCSWTTEDIDAGAFKASGTNIRTQLLLLEKSALAPEPILPPIPIISPVAVEEWMSDLPLFDYLTPATAICCSAMR